LPQVGPQPAEWRAEGGSDVERGGGLGGDETEGAPVPDVIAGGGAEGCVVMVSWASCAISPSDLRPLEQHRTECTSLSFDARPFESDRNAGLAMDGAGGADTHRHRRFPKCKAINGLRTGCASRMLSLTGSSGLRSLSEPSGDISASDNG